MEKIIEGSKDLFMDAKQKILDKGDEYFGDQNFKKVHEGNESKAECEKLYQDLSSWHKKMNYKDPALVGFKCTLYIYDDKKK